MQHKNYVALLTDTRQIKQIGAGDWENEEEKIKIEAPKNVLNEETKKLADKFKIS